MTKRFGSYQNTNGKKPKLDEDEPWDDDLDADALDRCFELATQVSVDDVVPIQSKDASILPTYNAFKNPSAFSSSTQANISSIASTSKVLSLHELESENRSLKQQNKEKEGEISILRSKLKESATVVQVEQKKTTNEWREKLYVTQKEVKAVKSELEFKNLEIANLKQQLAENRRVNLDVTLNNTKQHLDPKPVVKVNLERIPTAKKECQKKLFKKEAIVEPVYPLKSISPNSFTDPAGESHMIKNVSCKISRNTIPYLQNQQTYNEESFQHKCPRLGNRKITLDHVYPDIFKLVNSTSEELKSNSCIEPINKIIYVTLILLKDLNDYLVEFGSHLRSEDVQQSDANYLLDELQRSIVRSKGSQLGTQASKIVDVISQLISHNVYTSDFICFDKPLKLLPNTKEYAKLVPHRNSAVQNDYYLLRLLLAIVGNIGKYRLANQTDDFLLSVINLLERIAILDNTNYMDELTVSNKLFCKLFKEIVFARPGHEAIQKITSLLKVGSRYKTFLQYLFKKNGNNELLKAGPKGVLYYNEDVCSFCVLAILLQNYALRTEKFPLGVCYNMLSFIYNTFKTSHWIHHESGDNVCVCLSQLYKLEIDFVCRGIEDFVQCYGDKTNNCRISDEWTKFLNHEIIQKVLNQMTFNNFELTEKYVTVFSQFKEIEKTLKNEGLFNLAQLNISEELIRISHKSFNKDF